MNFFRGDLKYFKTQLPKTKKDYKWLVWELKRELEELENKCENEFTARIYGVNNHWFQELFNNVLNRYELVKKHQLDGNLRLVNSECFRRIQE